MADTSAIVRLPLAEGEGARIRLLVPVVRDRKSRPAARSAPLPVGGCRADTG
ncbi:hypothetical protein [Streptomyces europaeiscabiei]|uniref:hypothetical protein n=1 Tax=Streptomyces europaeiscabiei TaxID=146819 RepID=UPI002E28A647|nr:hypothetical protein [Streptomyces europaeiscabiei]